MSDDALRINKDLSIPLGELRFRFARSSGPGGQKVNRTASRVELLFDVAHSPSLTSEQRVLALHGLRHYVDGEGRLHLFSQTTPSQWRNRQEVLIRFRGLLAESLRVRRKRIPTRQSRASRERRLQSKRRRSLTKNQRRRPAADDS